MNQFISNNQAELVKALEFFKKDIASLRTGRAHPGILDNVQVEAYETYSPLSAVGNIAVSDGHSLVVTAWDKSILKEIEKAIVAADLGVSVVNEGDKIRISVPMLTEENRKELVKKLNVKMEEVRVMIRKIRDDIKTQIEKAFADKEINEDDKFRYIKDLDEEITKRNEEVKAVRDVKEKDIMTI